MPTPSADANLLFGILALQNNFIAREALLAAFAAWVIDKSQSLGDLLLRDGKLTKSQLTLLTALVAELLSQHGDSPEKCLERLSSIESVRGDLHSLRDPDIEASLHLVSQQNYAGSEFNTLSLDKTVGNRSESGARFRILRPHARGGLGEVFVAHDEELGREVALKEIQLDKSGDLDARSRFTREAEITGGLEHPSIVPVYGLGQYNDGRPFYAMRFIKGDSLKDAIQAFHGKHSPDRTTPQSGGSPSTFAKPKPPREAEKNLELRRLLQRFIDVCEAIEYAHSRGVLHRDLKPGNIMLGKYGETLVVDWGLAKVSGSEKDDADETLALNREQKLRPSSGDSSATVMGSALGTPAFMPPEQAQGRLDLLGPRSDVYSLGATLYTILTGKPPVDGNSAAEVLSRVIAGQIAPPRSYDRSIPRPLEAICLKALSKEPADRYASAKLLQSDLEKWLADEAVQALTETLSERIGRSTRRHRAWVQAGALAILLVAVTAIGAYFYQRNTAAENLKLADAMSQLAREKTELAVREQAAHQVANAKAISLRGALASNYFHHGVSEYDAGRFSSGILDLQRAWAMTPSDNPLRQSYQQVLLDRLGRGGRSNSPEMRHGAPIKAVAFSPLGDRVITGGEDKVAHLWDVKTGAPIGVPMEHAGKIEAVAFSPEGDRVVTASQDKTARLWSAQTGVPLGEPMPHEGAVRTVMFSTSGDRVLTGSDDFTARLWDSHTGAPVSDPMRHHGFVRAAVFSPSGDQVLTGSYDSTAQIWDAQSGTRIGNPLQHDLEVLAVAFSPKGDLAITGEFGDTARVWDVRSGDRIGVRMKHDSYVHLVAFAADGDRVLTVCNGNAAQLWDALTGAKVGQPMTHSAVISAAVFSPRGNWLLTASDDGAAQLRDSNSGAPVGEPFLHESPVRAAAFSPAGDSVLTACSDGAVRLWDLRADTAGPRQLQHNSDVDAFAVSPRGDLIATGSRDGMARLWDLRSGKVVKQLPHPDTEVLVTAFDGAGDRLATGSADGTVRIWDVAAGVQLGETIRHDSDVRAVVFSPEGNRILTGSYDKTARLWDANTGAPVGNPIRHDFEVRSVAFCPQGERLITGCNDKTARVWKAATGDPLTPPLQHEGVVRLVGFFPEADRVFAASGAGDAKIWDANTGALLVRTIRHQGSINAVALSPNGDRILVGSADGTAKIWDTRTGMLLGEAMRHDDEVNSLALTADGACVLTGSNDKTVRVWDALTGASLEAELRLTKPVQAVAVAPLNNLLVAVAGDVVSVSERRPLPIPAAFSEYVELSTGFTIDRDGVSRALPNPFLRALSPR